MGSQVTGRMSPCLYCPKVSASMAMFLTSNSEFLSRVQDYTGVTHPKQQFNSCLTTSLYNFRLDLKAFEVCQKSMGTNLSGSMAIFTRSDLLVSEHFSKRLLQVMQADLSPNRQGKPASCVQMWIQDDTSMDDHMHIWMDNGWIDRWMDS